jgi:hypothetical protein
MAGCGKTWHFPVRFAGLLLLWSIASAHAQLPLNIEELLVQPATVKLETGTAFRHSEELLPGVTFSGPEASPGLARRDLEIAELTSRLRYGLSSSLEVTGGLRVSHLRWRQSSTSGGSETGQTVELGVSWLASRDRSTPALLLQLSTDLISDAAPGTGDRIHGGAVRIAATSYRAIDPVVLSVGVGYEHRRPRTVFGRDFTPGATGWLIPQVNFAVNERVTLIGGFGLYLRGADRWRGLSRGERHTLTTLRLGSGLALGRRSTAFFSGDFAVSGERSARIALDWVYRF